MLAALSTPELAGLVVFGVLAVGVGSGLVYDAARRIRFRRRAREGFERVDATVLDAALHEPATGGRQAVPHVEYEYEVDGVQYTSRSLWPTRSSAPDAVDRSVARRIVEDYPAGAEVIARYDPADPGTAYLLEQYGDAGERVELVLGLVLLCAYAVAVVLVVGG